MNTGEIIKSLRRDRRITQKHLAELTGLATITIQQYEASKYKPKLEQLQRIAAALNVPVTDLVEPDVLNITNDMLELFSNSNLKAEPSTQNSSQENYLIVKFRELNEKGKKKATDYIDDLAQIPEYKKE